MTAEEFEFVLSKVAPLITKTHTKLRRAITAKERLALTLRFLATGESFSSLSFQFRIGESTVSMIVSQTCEALHRTLCDEYLKTPNTEKEWLDIAEEFLQKWQFPHCLGAIDGKHITIQPPAHSGSTFRNYKGRFSVVLMAVVDASYQFKYVSVGAQGRASDAGVFAESDFKQALDRNLLSIPAAKLLPGSDMEAPFVFLGDDAYPLRSDLMKPFSFRQMDHAQRVFNYRLSRGRRVVENGFGILANRWRVFLSTIMLNPDKVQKVVLACVCLHNYLREVRSETYTSPGLAGRSGNNSMAAKELRDKLKKYFVTPAGQVPWQDNFI
uniref:DDE Tnp4 domain-containing protein n=1 Tax=Myripristis murdjan TaxID=586833 RepID=A0A667X2E5_9TELE